MAFKVGDRVICRRGSAHGCPGKPGDKLTVSAASASGLMFDEHPFEPWSDEQRFVLLEETPPAAPKMVSLAPSDDTNPKDRLGVKKTPLNLVPPSSTIYQALAMEDGAVKYGPYNWRTKKVKASIYIAAALRHMSSWYDGEELAQDSQKPHLGHALACLGILVDAKETGNLVDDRPTPGPASKLIASFEKK